MSAWQKGEANSSKKPEVKAKMSESAKRRCESAEAKERMSEIGKLSKGKPKSEEQKAKISAAQKEAWAKRKQTL
jgi:hypothetical protein